MKNQSKKNKRYKKSFPFTVPSFRLPRLGRFRGTFGRIFLWSVISLLMATIFPVFLLRWVPPPFSSYMMQRKFTSVPQGFKQGFKIRYRWIAMNKISPELGYAVIAAEDQKFAGHSGFDFNAIQKAFEHNQNSRKIRGASTISQQVARNLFLYPGRSYLRKSFEAYFTVLIEWIWPKRRILEIYLNVAEFGYGIYGAHEAARYFFGAPPATLDARQAALLSAALPSPRYYVVNRPSPGLVRRQERILQQMANVRQDPGIQALMTLSEHP